MKFLSFLVFALSPLCARAAETLTPDKITRFFLRGDHAGLLETYSRLDQPDQGLIVDLRKLGSPDFVIARFGPRADQHSSHPFKDMELLEDKTTAGKDGGSVRTLWFSRKWDENSRVIFKLEIIHRVMTHGIRKEDGREIQLTDNTSSFNADYYLLSDGYRVSWYKRFSSYVDRDDPDAARLRAVIPGPEIPPVAPISK